MASFMYIMSTYGCIYRISQEMILVIPSAGIYRISFQKIFLPFFCLSYYNNHIFLREKKWIYGKNSYVNTDCRNGRR